MMKRAWVQGVPSANAGAGEGKTLGNGSAKAGRRRGRWTRGRGTQDEAPPGRRRPKETWRIQTDDAATIKHLI